MVERATYKALVPVTLLDELGEFARENRLSVNGTVELMLRSMSVHDGLVKHFYGMSLQTLAKYRLDEMRQVMWRLSPHLVAELGELAEESGLRVMRVAGALIAGNLPSIVNLIADAPAIEPRRETDGPNGRTDRGDGAIG